MLRKYEVMHSYVIRDFNRAVYLVMENFARILNKTICYLRIITTVYLVEKSHKLVTQVDSITQ